MKSSSEYPVIRSFFKGINDNRFFHFYRLCAYPFNPILVDVDCFESDLCSYLNAHAAGEFRGFSRISERWSTGRSIGHISLLLATLASGAHYSDLEHPQRSDACQELARRSFQALRLANFLFRPSLDTIQALLILGNTLQNNGQSDAAWALLGTTVRLAQTLGLHTSKSIAYWPECVQSKARALWWVRILSLLDEANIEQVHDCLARQSALSLL